MLFAPGAPREHYFEGLARLGDMSDDERREWFIKNGNFFIDSRDAEPRHATSTSDVHPPNPLR